MFQRRLKRYFALYSAIVKCGENMKRFLFSSKQPSSSPPSKILCIGGFSLQYAYSWWFVVFLYFINRCIRRDKEKTLCAYTPYVWNLLLVVGIQCVPRDVASTEKLDKMSEVWLYPQATAKKVVPVQSLLKSIIERSLQIKKNVRSFLPTAFPNEGEYCV